MSEDYIYSSTGGGYERITHIAGVKTTVCRNRFEVVCQDRGEANEQLLVQELRAWIAKRRQEEMRDAGSVPG